MRWIILTVTHAAVLAIGFALGVFFLPVLTAEKFDTEQLAQSAKQAEYTATLTRDLKGSDLVHWGEGVVSVSSSTIVHQGALSYGPDYKLYLTPSFVDDEASFNAIKAQAVRLGDIKAFDGFIVDVPASVDINAYNTVVVWCEAFGEFITAGQYR